MNTQVPPETSEPQIKHSIDFDVLIIGGGLSGIGAAYHLQKNCPGKSYAILECRANTGGTWDLFRYPGIRSDSDMFTLGYSFKPWKEAKAIADGPSILNYIRETARENGIDRHIRFSHWVKRASWNSKEQVWTVEFEKGHEKAQGRLTCRFLLMCSGYYSYEGGYTPEFPGIGNFKGALAHPQKWTDDIQYEGKKVVVIGSGATAVTLVPELAKKAKHVVMLQRTPTYMVSRPARDKIADWLRARLPSKLAYWLVRWKNVLLGMYFYQLCRRKPERAKQLIFAGLRQSLGPGFDIKTDFTPPYQPWDQRLCLVPDNDFFRSMKEGRSSVVTDHIETFTEHGIKLKSGRELEADLVVTATGLNLVSFGGAELIVDGKRVESGKLLTYKGMMYSGVPNLASVFGYTNASWTLKADLTCEYVCRLINHMDRNNLASCVPNNNDPSVQQEPWVNFSSGYFQRANANLPKQGSKRPWKLYQNYALDIVSLRYGSVEDQAISYQRRA